jgi:glycosyltransferase involved in cell wall biosynthesis
MEMTIDKTILIINYEMNSDSYVLAWQERLVSELSKSYKRIIVITEKQGNYKISNNVKVYSFPRLLHRTPLRQMQLRLLLNIPVFILLKKYHISACFIHMNHNWSYRLFPVFSILKIPVLTWYAHGTVNWKLKLALYTSNRIVTSTPEGCRLVSQKIRLIGQAVDTKLFAIPNHKVITNEIVYVGRISERKNVHLLLDVLEKLNTNNYANPFYLKVIGMPLNNRDLDYQKNIINTIHRKGLNSFVTFTGHVPYDQIPKIYDSAFIHLNLSMTGSMDKTIMESLACGCPVVTTNEALQKTLINFPEFISADNNLEKIVEKIKYIYNNRFSEKFKPENLRTIIIGKHDLSHYSASINEQLIELMDKKYNI